MTDPLTALRDQVENAIADPDLEPIERTSRLRDLRERLADVVGLADRYLSSTERLRESEASRAARDVLWARGQADLREQLEEAGAETGELPSHELLDELGEEGLLVEAAGLMRKEWDESKHKRGEAGKFAHTDFFKAAEGTTMAHTSRLRPTRQDPPEHVAKAAQFADEARQGLRQKRKPLDVRENGDGTLSIIDGNSTYEALKDKLDQFPVTIGEGDAETATLDRVSGEISSHAAEAEPSITPTLKAVTTELGGKLEGLEHKLKSPESIKSKIKRKQEKYPGMTADRAGLKILDAVRYTAVFPSSNYTQGISRTLDALTKQGFTPYDLKNYWGQGDDYDGFHAILTGPNGVKVELQFHTPESLQTKEKLNHPLFEQFRDSHDPKARYQLWQQMVANSAKIAPPPGIEALGPSRPSPSAEQRKRRQESPYEDPTLIAGDTANGVS